jgi:SAM-dependent MidA family methyltransferase
MAQGRPALALTGRAPGARRAPDRAARDAAAPTPQTPPTDSDPDLVAAIRARVAEAGGRVTFSEFMALALYHPDHGYYLAETVRSAREGDFLTAAELHPIFGAVVAGQLAEMWDLLERPATFTLREYGAGPGTLGLTIVETLARERPEVLAAFRYEPVEVNPAHRRAISARFAAAGRGDNLVGPGDGPRGASDGGATERIVGCVLANEFVDAFPVHRVRGRIGGSFEESYVAWHDGRFVEGWDAPSTGDLAAYLDRAGVSLAPGQIGEIDLAAGPWLDEVSDALERGYLLVIDYGHPASELYSPKRFAGTLLGYRGHAVVDDPLVSVGRQDLTAHVDFTTLTASAADRRLVPLGSTTQARLLVDGDLERRLNEERERPDLSLEAYLAIRSSIGRLLDPRALGGFGVLLFGRGVPTDRLPTGLGGGAVTTSQR